MARRKGRGTRVRRRFAALLAKSVDVRGAALFLRLHPNSIRRAIHEGRLPVRVRYRLVSHPRNFWTRYYEVPVIALLDHQAERVKVYGSSGRSRAGRPRSGVAQERV